MSCLYAIGSWKLNLNPESIILEPAARTFNDLVNATFSWLGIPSKIEYIDMPEDIRDKYQYFTEASMEKLRKAGYKEKFYSLEEGVGEYVRDFLSKQNFL